MQRKSDRFKRNYVFMMLEGAFFMGGLGFFSSSTVIPVFIDMMTHSKQMVGLTITLGSFLMVFSRIVIGPFVPHIRNHARFSTLIMFLCRPLTLIPAIFLFTGQDAIALFSLILSYSILWASDGLLVPPWSEVLANTVDEDWHGRLLGTQMLLGGMASIGAGALINVFLRTPALDMRIAFGWIFLLGGLLLTLSCFMMAFTENSEQPYQTGKVDWIGYYKKLPRYFSVEKDVTRVMFLQLILMFSSMCMPFIILFASESLGITGGRSANLILLQLIGVPIGGWLWGQVCDRLGCVTGLKLAAGNFVLVGLLPLLALMIGGNPMFVLISVMFLGGISGGVWTCYYLYTVQAARPESRSICLVLSSIVTLPGTFASYIAGFISDTIGYVPLFISCSVIALLGLAFSFSIRQVGAVVQERAKADQEQKVPETV